MSDANEHLSLSPLVKGVTWNLVGFAVSTVANLLVVTIVVNSIGLGNFGKAGVIIAFCSPIMIGGTTVGQALISQFHTVASGEGSRAVNQLFLSAMVCCLLVSMVIWLLVLGAGHLVVGSKVLGEEHREFDFFLLLMCASGMLLRQFTIVLQSLSMARMKFKVTAVLVSFCSAVEFSSIVLSLTMEPSITGFLRGLFFSQLGNLLIWFAYSRNLFEGAELKESAKRALSILQFVIWQGPPQALSVIAAQVDRFTLSIWATPPHIGSYNAAFRLQEAMFIAVSKMMDVLFPFFGKKRLSASEERLHVFLVSAWTMSTISAAIFSPIVYVAAPLLKLWLGQEVAYYGSSYLQSLAIAGLLGASSMVHSYFMVASAKHQFSAIINSVYSILVMVFSFSIVFFFGPKWAGMSFVVAGAARAIMQIVFGRAEVLKLLKISDVFNASLLPALVGILVALAACRLMPLNSEHWVSIGLGYVSVSLCVVSSSVILASMSTTGRIVLGQFKSYLFLYR